GAPAPPQADVVAVDPVALVQNWYRQFLDRDAEPAGLASWVDQLRRGQPPAAILAAILASDEYYQRAGSTPEGFVQALFRDLTGQVPPPQEFREWVRRVRPENRKEIAQDLLQRSPQAWQLPADPAQRNYLTQVYEQLGRL